MNSRLVIFFPRRWQYLGVTVVPPSPSPFTSPLLFVTFGIHHHLLFSYSVPTSSTLYVAIASFSVAKDGEEGGLSCIEELKEQGMIVPWCSQVEVLSHPSLGCFVTHCGWNSTLEGIASGVPMVAIPQWSDQATNAKFIQDVWKIGVTVAMDEEGVARGKEITKCLEMVMSGKDKAKEMKRNAEKWKGLAKAAAEEGGSSDVNLKAFLNDIWE
ncbi:crocetin glucosyltransferase [Sarracenia purpurea var. burkii]